MSIKPMLYSVSEPSESDWDGEFCLSRKRIDVPRLEHRSRIPSEENINRDPENNQDGGLAGDSLLTKNELLGDDALTGFVPCI